MNSRRRRQRKQSIIESEIESEYVKFNPDYEKVKKDVDTLYKELTESGFPFSNSELEVNSKMGWWGENDIIYYDRSEKPAKLFTFIMALRGRSKRALNSIKSIINEHNSKFTNFMIVEDTSEDMLEIPYEYSKYIDYNLVDNGEVWAKSPLLNFGIKRTKTPLVVIWDCDFIFPDNFMDILVKYIKDKNIENQFFCIPSFETIECKINGKNYKAGDPYGNLWVYPTNVLTGVNGFNEEMKDYSPEDREMEYKIYKYARLGKKITTYPSNRYLMVFHSSHKDSERTDKNMHKNRLENHKYLLDIKMNEDDNWGNLEKIN